MTRATQLVLRELLADPAAEKYGLEICKAVGLASGTVHPLLYKFENLGWLESRFETIDPSEAGRARRRFYRLTPDGAEFARDALAHAHKPQRQAVPLRPFASMGSSTPPVAALR
ncbi:MAG: helix-turn-helix transcriptional regulator [Pseudonocardiales bacterium]|nr:helix-turn-helix transcriptional regulator [Pseudonocardiales bacterium]